MERISKKDCGFEQAAEIVRDAGGKIVGRTRLQKIAYLLEISGLGAGFLFRYKHYGPYSEDLANSIAEAAQIGIVSSKEFGTAWGGFYSVFETANVQHEIMPARQAILDLTKDADPVALELAATAAFLSLDGAQDPWEETVQRKPEKAEIGLDKAKHLYQQLTEIETPNQLPRI